MGKIHEALKRAEEERARLAGVTPPSQRESSLEARLADRVARPRRDATALGPLQAPLALRPSELDAAVLDQYKLLRSRIQGVRRQRSIRSLVIASPSRGDGRTTTALELGRCYGGDREIETCVAELDLREPRLREALRGDVEVDVVDVLEGAAALHEALVPIEESRLFLLPARRAASDPATLIESLTLAQLVEALHQRFGFTIIDSPPLLDSLDGAELVSCCDAVLLAVRASVTTVEDLDRAVERIDSGKLIGTLLTRAPRAGFD